MQSLADALAGMVLSVAFLLIMPAVALLILRRYVPVIGNPLWRAYLRLLGWLVRQPIRLIQELAREAFGRRRP